MPERMINVAGFGIGVVRTREISAAFLRAKIAQPITSPIVEHPNPEIRVVHAHRADNRALQDCPVFIVGTDQDVDERPSLHEPWHVRRDGWRSRRTPGQQNPGDGSTNCRQHFRAQEADSKQPIGREASGRQGFRDSPEQVIPRHDQCDGYQCSADTGIFALCPGEKEQEKARSRQSGSDRFWPEHGDHGPGRKKEIASRSDCKGPPPAAERSNTTLPVRPTAHWLDARSGTDTAI
jgi:hypothetical protein